MPSTTHTQKPTTFSEFLACTRSVPEYRRPHYLRWVDLFLNSQSRTTASDDPLDDTRMKQFFQDLARRKEDWQVRQAEEVIALYRFYQTTLTQVPQQGDSLCADSSHWDPNTFGESGIFTVGNPTGIPASRPTARAQLQAAPVRAYTLDGRIVPGVAASRVGSVWGSTHAVQVIELQSGKELRGTTSVR